MNIKESCWRWRNLTRDDRFFLSLKKKRKEKVKEICETQTLSAHGVVAVLAQLPRLEREARWKEEAEVEALARERWERTRKAREKNARREFLEGRDYARARIEEHGGENGSEALLLVEEKFRDDWERLTADQLRLVCRCI